MCAARETGRSPRRLRGWLPCGLILALVAVAYTASLSIPLNFDDDATVTHNPAIRDLRGLLLALLGQGTTSGRPVADLTFGLNFAWGGTAVAGYHLVNLVLHAGVALTLFAVLRRALDGLAPRGADNVSPLRRDLAGRSTPLALTVASLWAVHPLTTAAVSYISQRTEILMAFFCLQTLLGLQRAAAPQSDATPARRGWLAYSVLCCAAGMACKESMVLTPFLVVLYDRVWLAGSFRRLWAERRDYYVALAFCLVLLALLLKGLPARSVGFGLNVSPWTYALTECGAILVYLKLSLWPHPLVFDYGAEMTPSFAAAAPQAGLLLVLLAATAFSFRRWPRAGFVAAAFFICLGPTSSFVPIALQPVAENRAYLPLAAVLTLVTLGAYTVLRRKVFVMVTLLIPAMALATVRRNAFLQDTEAVWREVVRLRPGSARGWENYAVSLCEQKHFAAALPFVEQAIALNPRSAGGFRLKGDVLFNLQRTDDAIGAYEQALALNPGMTGTRINLAMLLMSRDPARGLAELNAVLRREPENIGVLHTLSLGHLQLGDLPQAGAYLDRLDRLRPDTSGLHVGLANALFARGDPAAAATHYTAAVQRDPRLAVARLGLGSALLMLGRPAEALPHCEGALQLQPDYPEARHALAIALFRLGRTPEAILELEQAIRAKPDFVDAQRTLAEIRATTGNRR